MSRCRRRTRRRGFSISSILLLTAVVAVFSAAIAAGFTRGRPDKEFVAACAVGGVIVGGLVGIGVGLSQIRQVRGVLLGVWPGMIAGAMAGAMLAMPQEGLPAIVVGAVVVVAFGGVVRFFSKGPPRRQ